jgi:flagellar hook-associated protein 1 FlgK
MPPDLLSLLTFSAQSIQATNVHASVTANNIANANTEGYSRQTADADGTPVRVTNNLLASRIQNAAGSFAMSEAYADALAELERGMTSGGSFDEQVGGLFSKVGAATSAPTDMMSREAVITAARAMVANIQRRSAGVAAAGKEADSQIRDSATMATSLAKQLAAANVAVAKSPDPAALDERDRLAKHIGQLVGGQARIDTDGQMRYVLEGGGVLVDGKRAAALATTSDSTTGLARVELVDGATRRDLTQTFRSGAITGQLRIRDEVVPQVLAKIDQVAYDIATSLNAVHTANAGLDGVTGRPMFTPLTQVAGAAAAMAIDPALAADPKLLALAAPGAGPGDNRGALALFAVGSQNVASGGTRTLGGAALDVVSGIALAHADAKGTVTSERLVTDHLDALRDSLLGVDTQEELTNLARFEHASNAMAKVITTIDDMLASLINAF